MNWVSAILPEHVLSLLVFVVGVTGITCVSLSYAGIFRRAADKEPTKAAEQASVTFVSGHFLAFFLLPFALVVGASLAIVGKLDSGIAAIIGLTIGYIVNKVVIR